jgi:hypothetical protein
MFPRASRNNSRRSVGDCLAFVPLAYMESAFFAHFHRMPGALRNASNGTINLSQSEPRR